MKLTWSDLISIIFPGSILLLGLSPYYSPLNTIVSNPENLDVAPGLVLLFFSGILGGIVEGIRRIILDEIIYNKAKLLRGKEALEEKGIYYYLSPQNIELFKEGVTNSYKYHTFYSNLSIAILASSILRFNDIGIRPFIVLLLISILLFVASHIQWIYFNKFMEGFIDREKDNINNQNI